MTTNSRNVLMFASMSPPQPWPCHFCTKDVAFELQPPGRGGHAKSPTLHHVDGDHDNNDPSNWAWAHLSCHAKYHGKGRTHSALNRKISGERMRSRMAGLSDDEKRAHGLRGAKARWSPSASPSSVSA